MTSAVVRTIRGDAALLGPTDYLLSSAINVLRVVSWQLGQDNNAPKPVPVVLPGMTRADDPNTVRGDSLTTDELDAVLEDRIEWSKRQQKR